MRPESVSPFRNVPLSIVTQKVKLETKIFECDLNLETTLALTGFTINTAAVQGEDAMTKQ